MLKKEPAIVVIYIGVNDVWHKRTGGTGTDADKFERFYSAMIKKLERKEYSGGALYPGSDRRTHRFQQ